MCPIGAGTSSPAVCCARHRPALATTPAAATPTAVARSLVGVDDDPAVRRQDLLRSPRRQETHLDLDRLRAADLGCLRRLVHLDELQTRARAVNTCVLASPAFERIAQPTLDEDGRKAPALRFGDPRVQALAGTLCTSVLAVTGITNKSLRALMTGLLGGANYTMNQASYDLARLRVNGLITRIPGRNRYRLTDDGLRFAIFYTKVHERVLRPLLAADKPPAPTPIRKALHTIDIHITETIEQARLLPKAA